MYMCIFHVLDLLPMTTSSAVSVHANLHVLDLLPMTRALLRYPVHTKPSLTIFFGSPGWMYIYMYICVHICMYTYVYVPTCKYVYM